MSIPGEEKKQCSKILLSVRTRLNQTLSNVYIGPTVGSFVSRKARNARNAGNFSRWPCLIKERKIKMGRPKPRESGKIAINKILQSQIEKQKQEPFLPSSRQKQRRDTEFKTKANGYN